MMCCCCFDSNVCWFCHRIVAYTLIKVLNHDNMTVWLGICFNDVGTMCSCTQITWLMCVSVCRLQLLRSFRRFLLLLLLIWFIISFTFPIVFLSCLFRRFYFSLDETCNNWLCVHFHKAQVVTIFMRYFIEYWPQYHFADLLFYAVGMPNDDSHFYFHVIKIFDHAH